MMKESVSSSSSSPEVTGGWKHMKGKHIFSWGSAITVGILSEQLYLATVLLTLRQESFSMKELGGYAVLTELGWLEYLKFCVMKLLVVDLIR